MSGPKDKDLDLDGLDWDAALQEWEEKTFLPETAKDRETQQHATLQTTPTPPPPAPAPKTPPPTAPQAFQPASASAPPSQPYSQQSTRPLYVPSRPAPPKAPPSRPAPTIDEEEDETNATVVAAIPRELLRRESGSPSRPGGGLGQMFAKTDRPSPTLDMEDAPTQSSANLDDAPTANRIGEQPHEPDADSAVFTSAKAMHALRSKNERSEAPPRVRQPSATDEMEALPDGAMFDPFAEPDPFGKSSAPPPPASPDDTAEAIVSAAEQDADAADIDALLGTTASDAKSEPPTAAIAEEISAPGPALHQPDRRVFDAAAETSGHLRGAIHAPSRREYDPNEETSVLSKAAFHAKLAEVEPSADDEPTRYKNRSEIAHGEQSWKDERPAADRLDAEARAAFEARAGWIEAEARASDDRGAKARGLLAASELRAILGDAEQAEMLAREAAATQPTMALPPRQARALAIGPRDAATLAEALDAEARQSPTQAAMLHDALLAADVLRLAGDMEGAAKRWDRAIRIAPGDPRAPLARACERIGRGDLSHPSIRLPDAADLAPLAEAIARVMKIRGAVRADVATDEPLANDALRRAREAIDEGDLARAAAAMNEVARVTELREAASWAAASLGAPTAAGRTEAIDALRVMTAKSGPARRALVARALEMGAADVVEEAALGSDAFTAADRAVLALLAPAPRLANDEDLDALGESPPLAPMAAAIAAVSSPSRRVDRIAGSGRARDLVRLARAIATDGAPAEAIDAALEAFAGEHDGKTRALALETAARAGAWGDVSDALLGWTSDDEDAARDRSLAAGLVAERVGDPARAAAAYASAAQLDATCEAAIRAEASLDPQADLASRLRAAADAREGGVAAAAARLEALARAEVDDATRVAQLEAAHVAAPSLPIAAHLAERAARRAGDVDAVLRWIRERRAAAEGARDAIEDALDAVREALLVADTDARIAGERLAEAHAARREDVALRELYERVAVVAPDDRAAWREQRAATSPSAATKARLLLEAVHEREQAGDAAAALRDARAAFDAEGDGLARLALERAEMGAGEAARLADNLLAVARSSSDARERREAYERLADLDATGRDDPASALLWHRTILEETPAFAPSLRHVEHALISDARVDELEPVSAAIARTLAEASGGAEAAAHAQMAARLKMRGAAGEWEPTLAMVELAASFPEPTLWSLRALSAHARSNGDEVGLARASLALAERTTRSAEIAALVLRAGEAAMREGDLDRARELLERAATEDPGCVVTWGLLAEVRQRLGDARGAAEACESLARSSVVDEHRVLAWYDAGRLWLDEVHEEDRGVAAMEQTAALDVGFQDVFTRLSVLYTRRNQRHELAALLERRIEAAQDDEDRVRLEIDRARALAEVGDTETARRALESALQARPDDVSALGAYADLCAQQHDWERAEQAWVRLSRLVPDAESQRAVYARLGELYSEHAPNLSRAEVALKEVLKRSPDDPVALERLVSVYKRLHDGPRALEVGQQLLKMAHEPAQRRARLVDLASIHETVTRDLRKAEQTLEAARREFPNDVGALRALVEFYQRQRQMPAVNILLDRASGDARRALAAGRFSPALFEVLQAVFDLRGKRDAAKVVAASLAAMEAQPANVPGAAGRAGDPRFDDLLAPEALGPGLRALLARAGDALDGASALDLRALHAVPLSPGVAQSRIAAIASSMGVPPVQVLVSPNLGRTCVPSASSAPAVVIGEPLLAVIGDAAAAFVVTRAMKLVQAHASALVRTPPADLAVLVAAWLQSLNPSWKPEGIAAPKLAEASRRVHAGLPAKSVHPETAMLALEVAGTLGPHLASLGAATIAWADRVALLAVGDPNAALDGIAWSLGMPEGAPRDAERRAQWVLHAGEARDLLVFSTSDGFAEARARSGLGS